MIKKLLGISILLFAGLNIYADQSADQDLFDAITYTSPARVDTAFNRGANANATSGALKLTPLHVLTHYQPNRDFIKVRQIAKKLLAQGANINASNKSGRTPLHSAAFQKNLVMLNFLLNNGADIEARDNNNQTPLHLAARTNDLQIVKALLNNGANPRAHDSEFKIPEAYTTSIPIISELRQAASRRRSNSTS